MPINYNQNKNSEFPTPEEVKKFFENLTGGFGNPSYAWIILLVIAVVITLWTTIYTVQPDEQAVIIRFGKFETTTEPGLHFKIPFGVDEAVKVKTKLILQQEFGFRTDKVSGAHTTYSDKSFSVESLMLTGDLNVADVEWIVQFQINNPRKFLFQSREPVENLRDVSQSIMRRVVGDRLVNDVLTVGRIEIAEEAMRLLQETLDKYDLGIYVVAIKLQDVNPPEPVKPSFNEVNAAKQEQEQLINQAEKIYNKVIPEAKGKAEKQISEAQGYATSTINKSKGDTEKFNTVLAEYKKSPEVTRKRMYIEAMQEVLHNNKGIILIDESLKGIMPIYEGRAPDKLQPISSSISNQADKQASQPQ